MNEQFKKARDAEAMDRFMYSFSPISDEAKSVYKDNCRKFCKGANWAYEWCLGQDIVNAMKHNAAMQRALEKKLAVAVEALYAAEDWLGHMSNDDTITPTCNLGRLNIIKALEKIKSMESE